MPVTAGNSYYVQVGGWNGATGTTDLTISNSNAGPADCNSNGILDSCETDTDSDGTIDDCDDDIDGDGIPNACDVDQATAPSADTFTGGADNCADASTVFEGVHTVDNTAATTDGPTDGDSNMGNDVWFLYTAGGTGDATIETCGSAGSLDDTVLIVYDAATGCPVAGDLGLASDDDGCTSPNFSSTVTIPVTGGNSYYVQVGGWNGATGTSDLTISNTGAGISDCNSNGQIDSCETDTDSDGTIDDCDDDIDGDGIPNACDVDQTGGADCDVDGQDDSCQTDTDSDGTIDACDDDIDGDGIPNACDVDQTGGADCDVDGQDDSCQTDTDSDGTIDACDDDIDGDGIPNACDVDQTGGADCDLNGQDDSCETDTDSDGTIDACDDDIDGDGILNECDLDQTGGADCNENGVDDSCDIVAGEADNDSNGIPDVCEESLFIRGDANDDGGVDLADGIQILSFLFAGDSVVCPDAADTTDDGQIDISDAVALFSYQFSGGAPPTAPFPGCGTDDSSDSLGDCNGTSCAP